MKVTVERQHAASAEGVFERLADLSAIRKMVGMDEANYVDDQAPCVGAKFATVDAFHFKEKRNPGRFTWTIKRFDAPNRFVAEMDANGASMDFELSRNERGCLIRLTRDERPDASDFGVDRLIFHLMQLIPPVARKAAIADAQKDIDRI